MGDSKDWQTQLLGAALMAATRTAIDYATNPDARDQTAKDMRSRLAEVDYTAAAKALSKAIDQFAENSKSALNEAIDSLRENAEDAVEAAAEKAQEQLGSAKRGRGRMILGLLLGLTIGFMLLNEERRNQIMDKLTGATGSIDSGQWTTTDNGNGSPITPSSATETSLTVDLAESEVSKPPPASAPPNQETETVQSVGDSQPEA